jgi:hypothetical protein
MDLPLEITYQGIDRTAALDRLVERQAAKLEKFHPHITSVRVGLSRPNRYATAANPHRVRIRCTVPPGHELLVVSDRADLDPQLPLQALVRTAFGVLERKLKVLAEKQSGAGKARTATRRRGATTSSAAAKKAAAVRRRAAARKRAVRSTLS